MKVYLDYLRVEDYCVTGTQEFFARHNLDWNDFKRNGIESDALIATGDFMAIKLAEIAIKRSLEDGR